MGKRANPVSRAPVATGATPYDRSVNIQLDSIQRSRTGRSNSLAAITQLMLELKVDVVREL